MKIYKFKDTADGNHAFILAQSESEAWAELNKITALKCRLIDTRNPADLKKPLVVLNHILPFWEMKQISILIFIFFAALGFAIFWGSKATKKEVSIYYVEVIFNNGDRYNVVINNNYPKVQSTGCMWDGGSYICGVRQIIKIDTIKWVMPCKSYSINRARGSSFPAPLFFRCVGWYGGIFGL